MKSTANPFGEIGIFLGSLLKPEANDRGKSIQISDYRFQVNESAAASSLKLKSSAVASRRR